MSEKLSYKAIAEQFSQIPIEGFFDGLSECLALLLNIDCIIISKSSMTSIERLTAISFYRDRRFSPSFSYSITGAPCEDMLNGKPARFVGNIEQAYPNTYYLINQGFTHYLGFPLLDSDNKTIGYIVLLNRKIIADEEMVLSVLKIASQRAVRELVRTKNLEKIERLNKGLRLASDSSFFKRLVEIIVGHIAIDVAFIAQVMTSDKHELRIEAIGGQDFANVESIHLELGKRKLSLVSKAHFRFPQLASLAKRPIEAAFIIPLFDKSGQNIGYIGALSFGVLASIDSIETMLASFSARTELEIELQRRERQIKYFHEILSATDDLMSFVDHKFHYRALNKAYCNTFGKQEHELLNCHIASLHGQHEFEKTLKPSLELALQGETHTVELKKINADGDEIYLQGRHYPSYNDKGEVVGVVVSARDVTELKRIELALLDSEEKLHTLYHKTPSMFFNIDSEFRILSVNGFGAKKLGYLVDELIGQLLLILYSEDDRMAMRQRLGHCFEHPLEVHEWEVRKVKLNGRNLWVKQTAQVVNTANQGSQIFLASEDISEKHRLSQKLSYQATHDSLTGLNNRLEFERALQKLAERKEETKQQVHILCYIDLDKFKQVNDSCGHLAGDELLRNIADILTQKVRKSDVLARIGGDEFAILMENCELEKAREIAESIRVSVKDYVLVWKDKNYQVGASIGLTIFNLQKDSIAQALSAADEACYSAKAAGRDKVYIFSGSASDRVRQRQELEFLSQLKLAISDDEFELHAQPIFKAQAPEFVAGYELLLRLYKDGQFIDINKLFQMAEQHQLQTKIDEWVVSQGFAWLATTQQAQGYCSINISGCSAGDAEFLEYILYQLNKHNLSGHHVCFEITETATMSNLLGVTNFMTELRKHGCQFTLDNFGSGISSFNHMKNLSFDMVKISDEYVAGLLSNKLDRAMAIAVVDICRAMGKISVASGIEDQATYQALVDIGVDYVQGFYCGMPVPILSIE